MQHFIRTQALSSFVVLLATADQSWSADPGAKPRSSGAEFAVQFRIDPRLVSGVYGGERWVSPRTFVTTGNSVEVRVAAIDDNDSAVPISAKWIPANPEFLTISPEQGRQVTLTVKRFGQSTIRIDAGGISKELAITASANAGAMQVEIAQPKDDPRTDAMKDVSPAESFAGGVPDEGRRLQTPQQKLSYALGANLGNGLHRESVDVDYELVAQGLKDALSGSTPLMTQHEIGIAVAGLKTELTSKRITSAAEKINARRQAAEKNMKEGEAFLAENKRKDGVVTLDSGLQYKVLKGGNGKKPTLGDVVVCTFRGTLLDGTEFDSSSKRKQPAIVGLNEVIKGWKEALELMPVSSKWQLFIPPSLAYGERGSATSGIGPGATLIFEIELLSIKEAAGVTATAPVTHSASEAQ